jgi:ERCC4-type nuclease
MIQIFVSANEEATSMRPDELREALAIARAQVDTDIFADPVLSNVECDIMFVNGDGRKFGVEVKNIVDYISSIKSGHLGLQLIPLIEQQIPCRIAVLGSLDELPEGFSFVNAAGRRTRSDRIKDAHQERGFASTAIAAGIVVEFLSKDGVKSFVRILDIVKGWFLHDPEDLVAWMPKPTKHSLRALAMLTCARDIGPARARGILDYYGSIHGLCGANPAHLELLKINGRKIGPKAAQSLVEVLGIPAD